MLQQAIIITNDFEIVRSECALTRVDKSKSVELLVTALD